MQRYVALHKLLPLRLWQLERFALKSNAWPLRNLTSALRRQYFLRMFVRSFVRFAICANSQSAPHRQRPKREAPFGKLLVWRPEQRDLTHNYVTKGHTHTPCGC